MACSGPGNSRIVSPLCEKRVPLWDDMEEHFASAQTKQLVRELEEQSALVLDNESKERALVGEVISTVALAAQISREKNVSDHGIDMEIEFKDAAGEATGEMLFLQQVLRREDQHGVFRERVANYLHFVGREWLAQVDVADFGGKVWCDRKD